MRTRLRSCASWTGRAVAWLVVVVCAVTLTATVLVPRLAGATPYTVLSGSMSPALPAGSLVVVRPVDAGRIGVGDVITYQVESGRPAVATHRVVAQGVDLTGTPRFRTRGDANGAADPAWVRPVQVRGVVWYAVPYLGYAANLLTPRQRGALTLLAAGFLFGYAAWMLVGAARDRRRRTTPGTARSPGRAS